MVREPSHIKKVVVVPFFCEVRKWWRTLGDGRDHYPEGKSIQWRLPPDFFQVCFFKCQDGHEEERILSKTEIRTRRYLRGSYDQLDTATVACTRLSGYRPQGLPGILTGRDRRYRCCRCHDAADGRSERTCAESGLANWSAPLAAEPPPPAANRLYWSQILVNICFGMFNELTLSSLET